MRTRASGKKHIMRGIIANLSGGGVGILLTEFAENPIGEGGGAELSFAPGAGARFVGLPVQIVYEEEARPMQLRIGVRFADEATGRWIRDYLEETSSPQPEVA